MLNNAVYEDELAAIQRAGGKMCLECAAIPSFSWSPRQQTSPIQSLSLGETGHTYSSMYYVTSM